MPLSRIWFENERYTEGIGWVYDGQVYLPFYLDQVELGARVCDRLNGPSEEQLLEDMCRGRIW